MSSEHVMQTQFLQMCDVHGCGRHCLGFLRHTCDCGWTLQYGLPAAEIAKAIKRSAQQLKQGYLMCCSELPQRHHAT